MPGLRRDHRPPVRERTQRKKANPTRATGRQTELRRPGRPQVGGDLSRVPPARPSTEEREWIQPGHSRRAEAPFSPAPTEAVGRTLRETQRWGSAQQGAFQGRAEPSGQAASPGPDDQWVGQRTKDTPKPQGGQAPPSSGCKTSRKD